MTGEASRTLLDERLLARLMDRLVSAGAPAEEWTAPGLSIEEMEGQTAVCGLRLPTEAQVWWGWRNGGAGKVLPGWRRLVPLERAVETYLRKREVAAQSPNFDRDTLWNPSWFPIDDNKDSVIVDCATPPGSATPVRLHSWEASPEENDVIRADSMAELVTWWCEAIEIGAWEWEPEGQRWEPRWELLDGRAADSGVV